MEKTFFELEAGTINIRKRRDSLEVLLIYREKLDDYTFPKGHVEECETLEQAAIRETKEESGLEVETKQYIDSFEYKVKEEKDGEVASIIRRVYFFLTEINKENKSFVNPDGNEGNTKIVWLTAEEAFKQLDYETDKEILRKAISLSNDKSQYNKYALKAYSMIESKIKDDLKLKESVDFMGTLGSINDKEGVSTWSDLDILLILKSDEHGNVPVDIILKLKEIHNEVSNLFYGLEISLLTHTYHDFENYVSFEYLENYQFATIRSIFNEKEKLPKDFLKSVIEKREIDEETKKRFAIYYLRHMRFNLIRKIASWDGNDKAMAKLVVDRIMESAIWVMNYYGTFTQKKSERIDFIEKNIKDSKIVDIYKKCFKLRQEWPNITEEESMELIVTGLGYVGEIESYMDKKYPEPTPEELMNIISMTK